MPNWLNGWGTEGSLISILISVFLIYQLYIKPRLMRKPGKDRRKGNPHPPPGQAPECIEHVRKLAKIETKIEDIKEDIREIKTKLK